MLSVWVERGRNLRSPELGLPANVLCRVYWDPTRYLPEHKRKKVISIDKAAGSRHEIGTTGYLLTLNPVWNRLSSSDEAKRLKHLVPSPGDGLFFDASTDDSTAAVEFPVLQPIRRNQNDLLYLDSWNRSPAAVVFEVKYQDALNILPGSESSLGEVAIPFAKLCDSGEVSGWFKLLESGTSRLVALGTAPLVDDESLDVVGVDPQIYLRVRWVGPKARSDGETETEREASAVIQEELIRSAFLSRERSKGGLVTTSLGALNTVRGMSDNLLMVQNTLGSILDAIGSVRSIFNFSVSSRFPASIAYSS